MTAPMPVPDEFGANEILMYLPAGARPDNLGRVLFTVFWLDPDLPSGVRGQVFRTDPDDLTTQSNRVGVTVRRWTPKEGAP